ncbi:MAG: hypothetical protein Q9184_006169 [Pyrenodesmia sp. 2 TL-2023]
MAPVLRRRSQRLAIAATPNSPPSKPANAVAECRNERAMQESEEQATPKHINLPTCPPWALKRFAQGDHFPPELVQIIQAHQDPIIFSWSPLGAEWPPMKFPNRMSWVEGPNQTWIGCERETGLVRLNVNPFPDDSFLKHCSPGMFSSHDMQMIHRLKVLLNQAKSSDPEPRWCFEGFSADTEPFRSFVDAGLAPIDRDPDVVWLCQGGLYRAHRISTGMADDAVTPDLVVLASSGLTFEEYEESVTKYEGAWSCYGAVDSPVSVPITLMDGTVCWCPRVSSQPEYVTANHHFQRTSATAMSGQVDGSDYPETGSVEIVNCILSEPKGLTRERSERPVHQGAISDMGVADTPATDPSPSFRKEGFPCTAPIAFPIPCHHEPNSTSLTDHEDHEQRSHPLKNDSIQYPPLSPTSNIPPQNLPPLNLIDSMPPPPPPPPRPSPQKATSLPNLPFIHLPTKFNNLKRPATDFLPTLPDYEQRLRALQAFNRNAAATFAKITAQQRKTSDLKGAAGNRQRKSAGRKIEML